MGCCLFGPRDPVHTSFRAWAATEGRLRCPLETPSPVAASVWAPALVSPSPVGLSRVTAWLSLGTRGFGGRDLGATLVFKCTTVRSPAEEGDQETALLPASHSPPSPHPAPR